MSQIKIKVDIDSTNLDHVRAACAFLQSLNEDSGLEAHSEIIRKSKKDTPKTETPKTETPKTETPKTETLKTETPKTETLKTETPKTETPKTETPKTETSETDSDEITIDRIRALLAEKTDAKLPNSEANRTAARNELANCGEAPNVTKLGKEYYKQFFTFLEDL